MDNCIFCKIIAGEIPSASVYEDEKVKVFADISPASLGHLLVLPKKHAANLLEIESEDLNACMSVAQKVAKAQMKALHADGINLIQNNGEAAGQTVKHFHIHLIPRYNADKVNVLWKPLQPGMEEIQGTAQKVKEALYE